MQNYQSDRLLTRDEVEARFGISKRFLEVRAMSGAGPKRIYIGRNVRYRVRDIETWIEANATGGGAK